MYCLRRKDQCLATLIIAIKFICELQYVEAENKNIDLSRGFGDEINWLKLEDALHLSQNEIENKPIFLIIHKSWCGACQSKFKSN
jgi:hypothetical protein